MESCNWWFRACIWWQNPYRGISAQRQRGKGSMFAILFGSPGWKAQSWITKILRLEPSVWVVSMRNLLYPSHLRKAPLRIVSYVFGQYPNRFWPHPFLSNKQLFAWLVLYRSTSKHPPPSILNGQRPNTWRAVHKGASLSKKCNPHHVWDVW